VASVPRRAAMILPDTGTAEKFTAAGRAPIAPCSYGEGGLCS